MVQDITNSGFKGPNFKSISFASSRRGRYVRTHSSRHFTKFPFFSKNIKQSNLTFAIADNGKKIRVGSSKAENEWLDRLGIKVREKVIIIAGKTYVVDGFDPRTMTCFEYNGSHAHGSHKLYPNNRNVKTWLGKTPNELYNNTLERYRVLKLHGFKIFFVWDYQFKRGELGRLYRGGSDNLY
jgi:hypothetical protein